MPIRSPQNTQAGTVAGSRRQARLDYAFAKVLAVFLELESFGKSGKVENAKQLSSFPSFPVFPTA